MRMREIMDIVAPPLEETKKKRRKKDKIPPFGTFYHPRMWGLPINFDLGPGGS
jgi:hypothetical protein